MSGVVMIPPKTWLKVEARILGELHTRPTLGFLQGPRTPSYEVAPPHGGILLSVHSRLQPAAQHLILLRWAGHPTSTIYAPRLSNVLSRHSRPSRDVKVSVCQGSAFHTDADAINFSSYQAVTTYPSDKA